MGYTEHLYTQLVSSSNYNSIADSHILKFPTARNNSSHSFLVTVSNGERSPSPGFPKCPRDSATSFSQQ
jgi:hypothetical protein